MKQTAQAILSTILIFTGLAFMFYYGTQVIFEKEFNQELEEQCEDAIEKEEKTPLICD